MKKICSICGKETDLMSRETSCYSCRNKKNNDEITRQIKTGEVGGTSREDEIFCPYCGKINEICDYDEMYEEGEHCFICCECEKEFTVNTNVSYSFDTEKRS